MSDFNVGDIVILTNYYGIDKDLKQYPLGTKFIIFDVVKKSGTNKSYCVCRIQYDSERKMYNMPFDCLRKFEKNQRVNWSEFRQSIKISWTDLVDDPSEKFNILLPQIMKKIIMIPKADQQIRMLMSVLSQYSLSMDSFPISAFIGSPGCGKSKLGLFLCELYGNKYPYNPSGSDITQAALKRKLDAMLGTSINELPAMFYMDDLNANTLNDLLFTLFKRGTDRGNTIEIAGQIGKEIMAFRIDCPKVFSSIHKIWLDDKYKELARRIIYFEFKPYLQWFDDDHSEFYQDVLPENIISVESINWLGIQQKFYDFWENEDTYNRLIEIKRQLQKYKKHGISKQLFNMSFDLISIGVLCGYYDSIENACNDFRNYWKKMRDENNKGKSIIETIIDNYLIEVNKINADHIISERLNNYLRDIIKSDNLETKVTYQEVKMIMNNRNYYLEYDPKINQLIWSKK
jgi:energy-coupling factor transporter ATP-binding protein EcfA2